MDKELLREFIQFLRLFEHPVKKTYDLGLIVKEPNSNETQKVVLEEIRNIVPIEVIVYDEAISDTTAIEKIIGAFRDKKWVFLEIKKDLKSPLLNQLKHLANYNSFQIFDYHGQDVFEMKMPRESRIIVFAERDFIEKEISYPYFYTLFGPVLSL
ncbi:MAG: hypothetical protein RMJ65_05225 [candidate division WOR-3 bacterium]|nr:hypothetical protein [candidate division WOR-3 bacterium]